MTLVLNDSVGGATREGWGDKIDLDWECGSEFGHELSQYLQKFTVLATFFS